MKKRIIIVHGWEGSPKNDWMPWAKNELEREGYEVIVPAMPDSSHPRIEVWIPFVAKVVGEPRVSDILIGHSIGCQTIVRYLETLKTGQKVDKVILVASWISLTPLALRTPEDRVIVKPWFNTPIDFSKVKVKANSFAALFSDNDPYVPFEENSKTYKEKLGAKVILQKGKGHFNEEAGVTELPILLELVKR